MLALAIPPIIENTASTAYSIAVSEPICPLLTKSKITAIKINKLTDDIAPEIIPLNLHFFDAINPPMSEDKPEQKKKYIK